MLFRRRTKYDGQKRWMKKELIESVLSVDFDEDSINTLLKFLD